MAALSAKIQINQSELTKLLTNERPVFTREEGGGVLGVAEIPHGEHAVLAPGHQDVGLGGVSGQAPHSAALQNISIAKLKLQAYAADQQNVYTYSTCIGVDLS